MTLLDTSVILDLLRKKRYEAGSISVITLIEILGGIGVEKRAKVKELLEESFTVLSLDNKVIEVYCMLRDKGVPIPDADLLIAATALSRNLPIKTKDQHFKKVKKFGLKLQL
ncbi:TPA: type II toxin-antitoxin system VapC family toxin [Candidatus Bathyarchaeota archaeon]|nr:type II toxin-antitoxin system VapC family toxin [Candidatus Bathyarchaeota archaeon]